MMGNIDPISEIQTEIISSARNMAINQGKNPLLADIYYTLFFAETPLGIKEISEKTGYSIASISNSMEPIERFMDVKKFKKPGSKKVFFECIHNPQVMAIAHTQIFQMVKNNVETMKLTLKKSEERLITENREDYQNTISNLKKMRLFYTEMDDLIGSFLKHMIENESKTR